MNPLRQPARKLDAARAAWAAIIEELRHARMADAQMFAADARRDLDELLGVPR